MGVDVGDIKPNLVGIGAVGIGSVDGVLKLSDRRGHVAAVVGGSQLEGWARSILFAGLEQRLLELLVGADGLHLRAVVALVLPEVDILVAGVLDDGMAPGVVEDWSPR